MKTKLSELLDEHEGFVIFTCFLATGALGYFLAHFANLIH